MKKTRLAGPNSRRRLTEPDVTSRQDGKKGARLAGQDHKKKLQLDGSEGKRVGFAEPDKRKNQRKKADQLGLDIRIAGLAGEDGIAEQITRLDKRKKAAAVGRKRAGRQKTGISKQDLLDGRKKKQEDGKHLIDNQTNLLGKASIKGKEFRRCSFSC
jgi:hypothetical protein